MEKALLLGAKLVPPVPAATQLSRPRLMSRLGAGLDRRATTVIAGPGYGKTSLVADYFRELESGAVWLWVDPLDRDPWIFFQYLSQGLREHAPEFGEKSAGMWEQLRTGKEAPEHLADVFIREAEESLGAPVIVVMDGVHHLESSEAMGRALGRLLTYLPGTLHLILIGRTLPDFGLRSLAAEQAFNQIGGDELRFTLEETQALLAGTPGLGYGPDEIAQVHTRSRGWVTALHLLRQTAHLAPGTPVPPESIFSRTESEVFEYFSEEVFAAEPPDVREFLLASSLPESVDLEACASVVPQVEGPRVLAHLLRRNLFLSRLDSPGGYLTYDPLFRDFLRGKLQAERGEEGVALLESRWGSAFARRGDFARALRHWMASGDAKGIHDLLARRGRRFLGAGLLQSVREAASYVTERKGSTPAVEDILGEARRLAGDYTAAAGHFERALAAPPGSETLKPEARAAALQGLAYSLLKLGELDRAASTAEQALAEAGPAEPALVARILNTLSIVRYRQERLDEAVKGWQEALATARRAGDEHLTNMIAHNLGLPHAVRGDFQRAAECFHILTSPDNTQVGPEEGAACLNLARISTLLGDYQKAASLLGDALEIARKWKLDGLEADVIEAEGTLFREGGDLEAAGRRYAKARSLFTALGAAELLDNLAEEEALLASRRGDHAEALEIVERRLEAERAAGKEDSLASLLLCRGEVSLRAGDPASAAVASREAAGRFASLHRAYQECLARLWLAAAELRLGHREAAAEAAGRALRLSGRHGYGEAVRRAAAPEADLRHLLAKLPGAPSGLGEIEGGLTAPAAALPESRADLTVRLLGPSEVYRDPGKQIPARAWKIRRSLQIFCFLAASRSHRATKDRIIDALWGEARLSVIEKNFHPTISVLRRALNHGHSVPKNFVLYEGGAYFLNPAYTYDIDADGFEEKIAAARRASTRGEAAAALADYEAALALYRGPFLAEEYDEWMEPPRVRLARLHAAGLSEAAGLYFKSGNAEAGIACLRKLVEEDPLNEDSSCRLMRALGEAGRRSEVEREYARISRALRADLDSEPLRETAEAYRQALDLADRRRAGGVS